MSVSRFDINYCVQIAIFTVQGTRSNVRAICRKHTHMHVLCDGLLNIGCQVLPHDDLKSVDACMEVLELTHEIETLMMRYFSYFARAGTRQKAKLAETIVFSYAGKKLPDPFNERNSSRTWSGLRADAVEKASIDAKGMSPNETFGELKRFSG